MRVKKGNQELRIPDDKLNDYLAQGFDLISDRGEVIKLGTRETSVAAIAQENKELRRRNRLLEEGIKQRDEKIAAMLQPKPVASPAAEDDAKMEGSSSEPSGADSEDAEQFICEVCGKVCATSGGLAKHMKTHA